MHNPIQVTFSAANGETDRMSVVTAIDQYDAARLYAITLPQFDNVSATDDKGRGFDNTDYAYTVSGVNTAAAIQPGLYTSLSDITSALTSSSSPDITWGVSSGNHITISAAAANTFLYLPNNLRIQLGFTSTQLAAALPVAPSILIAEELPTLFPFRGILIESSKIAGNQIVDNKSRGFYYLPTTGLDLVTSTGRLFDFNSIGTELHTYGCLSDDWTFYYWAICHDGEWRMIRFPDNVYPAVTIAFE